MNTTTIHRYYDATVPYTVARSSGGSGVSCDTTQLIIVVSGRLKEAIDCQYNGTGNLITGPYT